MIHSENTKTVTEKGSGTSKNGKHETFLTIMNNKGLFMIIRTFPQTHKSHCLAGAGPSFG